MEEFEDNLQNEPNVEDLFSISDETDTLPIETVIESTIDEPLYCDNCRRSQHPFLFEKYSDKPSLPYELSFQNNTTLYINSRRKFRFIKSTQNENHATDVCICTECSNHLFSDDLKQANLQSNTWPGFIWGILTDEDILEAYDDTIFGGSYLHYGAIGGLITSNV